MIDKETFFERYQSVIENFDKEILWVRLENVVNECLRTYSSLNAVTDGIINLIKMDERKFIQFLKEGNTKPLVDNVIKNLIHKRELDKIDHSIKKDNHEIIDLIERVLELQEKEVINIGSKVDTLKIGTKYSAVIIAILFKNNFSLAIKRELEKAGLLDVSFDDLDELIKHFLREITKKTEEIFLNNPDEIVKAVKFENILKAEDYLKHFGQLIKAVGKKEYREMYQKYSELLTVIKGKVKSDQIKGAVTGQTIALKKAITGIMFNEVQRTAVTKSKGMAL
ncbi:MAG: hypothetical protein HPY53_01215 [Brevinematales bacterium]|nr:hypothetical protein [Brevinematales bacterium]